MAFTFETWQKQATEKLHEIGGWLEHRKKQDAPYLLYGTLCGLSLWPLVEAAQAGQLLPVVMALGSVAAGVGGNLLAEQIQRWQDRAEATNETEVATWVSEHAPSNSDLRDALDAILQKMGTIPLVQAELDVVNRQWFTETLRAELATMGNLAYFEATLIGSNVIVHGEGAVGIRQGDRGHALVNSQVAVERGIAAETVHGPAITGDDNLSVGGHVIFAEQGATVVIGEAPVLLTAVDRQSDLGRYLRHIISRNRYLQLQGIRSGGKLVHIELDQIYITLRATGQQVIQAEEAWLDEEARLAPGERSRRYERQGGEEARSVSHPPALASSLSPLETEIVTVSINEALAGYRRLVVLGDPGSGKTTLLRYLALLYARDLAEETTLVKEKLGLNQSGWLPILLPLRQIGVFLRTRPDEGTEGHALLLEFLFRSLENERIQLPVNFFDEWLSQGRAAILLDGLDEVADSDLRRRVARLVEAFVRAYSDCRFVVTSRIVGFTGPARLGEEFVTTTVRDFTLADVELFLTHWHRLVAIGQMGPSESVAAYAAEQTQQLLQTIQANERIRELAINPLLLTVIAIVHRDRVKLPDRRAELYAEAVDVLLGKWEEAKGMIETQILEGKPFDTGDKRLMLQNLALYMHEKQQKEIAIAELRDWLREKFSEILKKPLEVRRTVARFLHVIEERTGLLAARGEGVYAFSHLTFQEYLTALAVAGRDDYVTYTLAHTAYPWWREVVLLEAGYLSTQSRERTTRLIQAITNLKREPEPYHNLVLAAECLRDVGGNRVQGDLQGEVQRRLRADIELDLQNEIERRRPRSGWEGFARRVRGENRFDEKVAIREIIERKAMATQALVRVGAGYWTLPYGEPEWIKIPTGKFWLGEGKQAHRVYLHSYAIARVPITNAQYYLFVQATGHWPPLYWEESRPPKGKESHPVVKVTWYDALDYCDWLSQVTGKPIALPSEVQWEKAARGDQDKRAYPWGDTFDPTRCNSAELGLGDTTPVGIFPNGASPYGCLDMAGNIGEWTCSVHKDYPYNPADGREDLNTGKNVLRVVRGGSWSDNHGSARCAARVGDPPEIIRRRNNGFRVVISPIK